MEAQRYARPHVMCDTCFALATQSGMDGNASQGDFSPVLHSNRHTHAKRRAHPSVSYRNPPWCVAVLPRALHANQHKHTHTFRNDGAHRQSKQRGEVKKGYIIVYSISPPAPCQTTSPGDIMSRQWCRAVQTRRKFVVSPPRRGHGNLGRR